MARSRAARWGLLASSLALGAVLFGTTYWSHRSALDLRRALARGQADLLIEASRKVDGDTPGMSRADLEEILESQRGRGLRYIALVRQDGEVVVSAGEKAETTRLEGRPGELQDFGERMLLIAPPPRLRFPPPPLHAARRPPQLMLEFEPTLANALAERSRDNWLIGSAATALLAVAATVFFRLSRRAEQAELEAERRRHLASLGEMSAVLAHEIKNPLAALKGNAQLLAEVLPEDDKNHPRAERVVNAALRLETLTRSLLEFARSGEIERVNVAPGEVLVEAAATLDPERIVLNIEKAPKVWSLDRIRIGQVLVNLLGNALQAVPDGPATEASVVERKGQLVYSVRDHGGGLPEEELERIFEAFRTHKLRGTGLGLTVARRIVELHGGRISASNHPAGGALFEVCIPRG